MPRYEELRDKVAIVTGAARGIGRAVALRLAKEGVRVALADIDCAGVSKLADEIGAHNGTALAVEADISRADAVRNMIARTVEAFGQLSFFVANAGTAAVGRLIDTDEATWERVFAVNAKGTFLCCTEAARQMIRQGGGGRIVVNASGAGKMAPGKGTPLGVYGASKHAVIGFAKQLGLELSDHQILVNCICAGIVDTPMWDLIDRETAKIEGLAPGSVRQKAIQSVPLGRVQSPDDIANVVAFLCSDDASYMTADTVNVAGGLLPY